MSLFFCLSNGTTGSVAAISIGEIAENSRQSLEFIGHGSDFWIPATSKQSLEFINHGSDFWIPATGFVVGNNVYHEFNLIHKFFLDIQVIFEEVATKGTIFITATGSCDVISLDMIKKMKTGDILSNCGGGQVEYFHLKVSSVY